MLSSPVAELSAANLTPGSHNRSHHFSAGYWMAVTMATLKRQQRMRLHGWARKGFLLAILVAFLHSSMMLFDAADIDYLDAVQPAPSLEAYRHGSPASTSLASKQSHGFFNDIPDRNWKYMQEKAKRTHDSIRKTRSSRLPTEGESSTSQILNSLQSDFTCPHMTRVGGRDDGARWTCDPHRLLEREHCVIYSIGSDGTYAWEDALIDLLGSTHCEIHVFDPGNFARVGDPELKNIHYHQWGIKGSYNNPASPEGSLNSPHQIESKMLSVMETAARFNAGNRTIDIVKFDCDDCEWASYHDWLSVDFRQVLIKRRDRPTNAGVNERHSQLATADFFDGFVSHHFALFNKQVNWHGDEKSVDFGYVKLHSDFWKQDGKTFTTRSEDSVVLPRLVIPNASTAFKVPRQLIFVSDTEDPSELFFKIRDTVDVCREAWGVSEPRVWFLDDLTCLSAISEAKKELVPVFRAERNTSQKMDMCRVAALYLSGGYQIDVDLELRSIPNPPDNTGLVVAREGDVVSKQFIASEPKCGILKAALHNMVELSKQKQTRPDFDLVTEALSLALRDKNLGSSVKIMFGALETIGGDVSMPWIITEMPTHSFDNPVPLEMRGPPSPGYKVPRRLIFIHKHNLLETKDPPLLYENVQKTIQTYREAWGDPKALVWFLNDTDCRAAVYAAKPNLLSYYDQEVQKSWKGDICRVAALYLTGGYYFDVSAEIVSPWLPDHNVTLVAAVDLGKTRYLRSFLASERKGRILEEALDIMLLFYEQRKSRRFALLGSDSLKWAAESIPQSDRGKMKVLEQVHFFRPLNSVVKDAATNLTLFSSQVPVR